MTTDLSHDLRVWARRFGADEMRYLFPLVSTCEFSNMPMHGCECNGCAMARLHALNGREPGAVRS